MKALLIETEYNKGFIIEGELAETIKLIDKFTKVYISGDNVTLAAKNNIKYSIVEKPTEKEENE